MLRLEDVGFALKVVCANHPKKPESSEKTKMESRMNSLMPHLNFHWLRIVRVIPFRPV